jgi:hypothetical protein
VFLSHYVKLSLHRSSGGGFFLLLRIFPLDLPKTALKVCLAPSTWKGTAQMEEVFFGKHADSDDLWTVYLDIDDESAHIQIVMENDDAELIRDAIYLPTVMLPALATAIAKYFAGSRKLEVVI